MYTKDFTLCGVNLKQTSDRMERLWAHKREGKMTLTHIRRCSAPSNFWFVRSPFTVQSTILCDPPHRLARRTHRSISRENFSICWIPNSSSLCCWIQETRLWDLAYNAAYRIVFRHKRHICVQVHSHWYHDTTLDTPRHCFHETSQRYVNDCRNGWGIDWVKLSQNAKFRDHLEYGGVIVLRQLR